MRTTITLDPDVEALVREAMRERGLSFKQTLNQAVRTALNDHARAGKIEPFHQRSVKLGRARADLTKALSLAGELDDQDVVRRHRSA